VEAVLYNGDEEGPVKVLIDINHPIFRAVLEMLLSRDPELAVDRAVGHAESVDAAAKIRPHVIVLAVESGDDLDHVPTLFTVSKYSKILALISSDDVDLQKDAVNLGITGIVSKSDEPSDLFGAIKSLRLGESRLPSPVVAEVITENRLNGRRKAASHSERQGIEAWPNLSPRERRIVKLICDGLNNKDIAGTLKISVPTVKHHLRNVFSKLDVANRAELVAVAYREGILSSHSTDTKTS
jgi:DNA-binding NarL/FixJ family response regulator